MEEVVLAKNAEANAWITQNVDERIIASLQSWARRVIDKHDPDDCAYLGTILFDAREMCITVNHPRIRAYTYGLIFQWDDGRPGLAIRAALRTNDSNQVVEFIPVDEE